MSASPQIAQRAVHASQKLDEHKCSYSPDNNVAANVAYTNYNIITESMKVPYSNYEQGSRNGKVRSVLQYQIKYFIQLQHR